MKLKPSVVLLIIVAALAVTAVFIYRSKSKTMSGDSNDGRNFSYKDTAAITKIYIADKEGTASTVVRTKKGWVVNDKFDCRSDAILNLLEVIKNVEVKMAVDKASRNSVIKFMSTGAVKVEIYVGNEKVRQYYVGHETADSEGSYMLLSDPETDENYKDPYVCFIPGFIGYLAPRFIVDENEWRDRVVLNYIPPQLKSVSVQHLGAPDSSFTIELQDTKTFKLKNGTGAAMPFDENKMKQYLAYYQNISYEALITGKNVKLQDSLAQQRPFCIITLQTVSSGNQVYKFYRKQYNGPVEHGVTYNFDPDHLYLRFNNDKEWAIIQYFVFGKLLMTPLYFAPPAPVKK